MGLNFFSKLKLLLKAIKIIKNWHLYPLVYFRLIKDEHVTFETRTGIKIKLRVRSTDIMAFTHIWILEEYNESGFEIHDDDIIIDIGAHIGLFTLYASQFCKNGKIYCFEPVDENYNLLLLNLKSNDIKNVIPKKCAVSHETGNVKIYLNQDESSHSMHISGSKYIQTESISLKGVIDSNNLEKCNLIKIDCEGEEYAIINSLSQTYFDKISKMCIEYHFANEKPFLIKDLTQKLKSHSYTVSSRAISDSIGFLYATSG